MLCLNSCRKLTVGFVAGILALVALLYFGLRTVAPSADATDPKTISRPAIEALFNVRLPDQHGTLHGFDDWRNKTLIVNFWASWCQPCREEMPAFSRLQMKYADQNVQFVGIAVDNAKNVADFAEKLSVSYPLLIAESEGSELMRQLGNTRMGLPYTLVITRSGEAGLVQLGRLSEQSLDEFLRSTVLPH